VISLCQTAFFAWTEFKKGEVMILERDSNPPETFKLMRGPSEPIPPGVEPEFTTQLRQLLQQGPIRPPGTVKDAVAFLISNGEAKWNADGTLEAVKP
jgi:hypothetical protein